MSTLIRGRSVVDSIDRAMLLHLPGATGWHRGSVVSKMPGHRLHSRLQELPGAAAPGAHEELPVVQPVLAVAPELDRLRHEAEPRPVRRARHLVGGITPAELPPTG